MIEFLLDNWRAITAFFVLVGLVVVVCLDVLKTIRFFATLESGGKLQRAWLKNNELIEELKSFKEKIEELKLEIYFLNKEIEKLKKK